MPQVGVWLLANIFSALLPPSDPSDRDFYVILGVARNATNEQVRKAYKVKSLQLHPDKVAQRRGNREEAAKEYEKVQEAYGVLVNDDKRQRYHALQCSPTRYRFVAQGALSNPGALYENLTNASTRDKTRLVLLCTLIVLTMLTQPILVAAKVNHLLEPTGEGGSLQDTQWVVVLIPFWIFGAVWVLFWAFLLVVSPVEAKLSVLFPAIQYILWYIGTIFLALKWDQTWTSSYARILVPVYLAMVFRWLSSIALMQKIARDIGKMVTLNHLEEKVLEGRPLDDLSPEESEDIRMKYLVITVPPEFEPDIGEPDADGKEPEPLTDEELEAQKVEASPEYHAASEIYNDAFGTLAGSIIFGVVFLIVLTRKLDDKIDASYWLVFLPIWIAYGTQWLYNCLQCTCATVSGDEVILNLQQQASQDTEGENKAPNGDGEDLRENFKMQNREKDSGFIDPEASLSKFNKSTGSVVTSSERQTDSSRPDQKKQETSGAGSEDKIASTESETGETDRIEPKDAKNGDTNEGAEDEADPIHIDEETFRAWQSAYAEAERGALEQQAKASSEVCWLTAQLIILIMVVSKVDQNYDNDDPTDAGFNVFWILFPFFLIFGLILCCCACLIYGAAPGTAADLYGGVDESTPVDNDVETPSGTANVVVMEPPPAEDASSIPAAASTVATEPVNSSSQNPTAESVPSEPEEQPDMDDLD